MKAFTITVLLAAVCVSAASADVASIRFTYSPVTIVCRVFEVDVSMGPYAGGIIIASYAGKPLLNASPGYGISFDRRRCKRLRAQPLPKAFVPRPSYPPQGTLYECAVSGPVVIHARFLRTGRRLTGMYTSIRVRRTGRYVAAGVVTTSGRGREFIGATCVGR